MPTSLVLGVVVFLLAVGCSSSEPDPSTQASTATAPVAESKPAEVTTPGPATTAPPLNADKKGEDEEKGHDHEAPHGGSLVELGDEYAHVELVLDSATGTLTAYVLDGEAEAAVRVTQATLVLRLEVPGRAPGPITLAAVENALTGETRGDTSQFQSVVPALKGVNRFHGSLAALTVRGREFRDVAVEFPAEH